MEKREKIEDLEFIGVGNQESSLPEGEEVNSEKPENGEREMESEQPLKEKDEDRAEAMAEGVADKDEPVASKEEKRQTSLEQLFGQYPETKALLSEDKDFGIDDSLKNFMATVEGFARGGRLSKEEVDSALTMLFNISSSGRRGSLTLDMMEVVMKGLSYDRRLAEEVHAAELRGRNANIEAKMKNSTGSDGVPHLESRGSGSQNRNRGIFSLAERAR